jgi:hypothetical protein
MESVCTDRFLPWYLGLVAMVCLSSVLWWHPEMPWNVSQNQNKARINEWLPIAMSCAVSVLCLLTTILLPVCLRFQGGATNVAAALAVLAISSSGCLVFYSTEIIGLVLMMGIFFIVSRR